MSTLRDSLFSALSVGRDIIDVSDPLCERFSLFSPDGESLVNIMLGTLQFAANRNLRSVAGLGIRSHDRGRTIVVFGSKLEAGRAG